MTIPWRGMYVEEGCSLGEVWKHGLLRVHMGALRPECWWGGKEKQAQGPLHLPAQVLEAPTISSRASLRSPLRLLCR